MFNHLYFVPFKYCNVLDIDDCRIDLCFPGVKCEDLKAPMRGYKCGSCPAGFVGNGKHCKEEEEGDLFDNFSLKDMKVCISKLCLSFTNSVTR